VVGLSGYPAPGPTPGRALPCGWLGRGLAEPTWGLAGLPGLCRRRSRSRWAVLFWLASGVVLSPTVVVFVLELPSFPEKKRENLVPLLRGWVITHGSAPSGLRLPASPEGVFFLWGHAGNVQAFVFRRRLGRHRNRVGSRCFCLLGADRGARRRIWRDRKTRILAES